ncbi:MAG: response regulator transcription factor [Actinomycetota bacterium]|nr:response regulator transcription factor [Actinomycetota bacterium]
MLSDQPDLEVVAEAADGHEALELCRQYEPEVVLMDLRMPTMDGFEATQAIKRELPSTIVLVLTAFEDHNYLLPRLRCATRGTTPRHQSSTGCSWKTPGWKTPGISCNTGLSESRLK